jgi:hypothetical protein
MRCLLAIPLLLLTVTLATAAWAEIGQIVRTMGQASLLRDGKIITAKVGLPVEASDLIVTGKDGRMGIAFTDNSRFAAGPDSRIELSKFTFNPTTEEGEFVTKVNQGVLAVISGSIAKHHKDAMQVRTPSSVLGVRGTKFLVKVAP